VDPKVEQVFRGDESLPFNMLIEYLIPNPRNDIRERNIKGCPVWLPETIFFDRGKISWIAHTDPKDLCLSKVLEIGEGNPGKQNEMLRFESIVAKRKAKTAKFWTAFDLSERRGDDARTVSRGDVSRGKSVLSDGTGDQQMPHSRKSYVDRFYAVIH
jgi:hypothetical protein